MSAELLQSCQANKLVGPTFARFEIWSQRVSSCMWQLLQLTKESGLYLLPQSLCYILRHQTATFLPNPYYVHSFIWKYSLTQFISQVHASIYPTWIPDKKYFHMKFPLHAVLGQPKKKKEKKENTHWATAKLRGKDPIQNPRVDIKYFKPKTSEI